MATAAVATCWYFKSFRNTTLLAMTLGPRDSRTGEQTQINDNFTENKIIIKIISDELLTTSRSHQIYQLSFLISQI